MSDVEAENSVKMESESSMDGPGKFVKKMFGIGKTKDSQTYTATVIPSSEKVVHSKQSSVTEVLANPSESVDSQNRPVYVDTASASIGHSSAVHDGGDTGITGSGQTTLTVPTYVISPDENNSKPGLAILITNSEFSPGLGSCRTGAEKDLNNMYDIFYHLNFEIRWKQFVNRTTEDLLTELTHCARDTTLEQKQCLAIVISSHGAEVKLGKSYRPDNTPDDINVYGHAITTYNGLLLTTQIMDVFDDENCPNLEGKPRLLFIQACRARNNVKKVDKGAEMPVTAQSANEQGTSSLVTSSMDVRHKEETPETEIHMIYKTMTLKDMLVTPCYENYMVVFASTEAHIAWSEDYGGVLLTNMYKVFKDKINKKQNIDLLPTMSEVNSKMAAEWESNFSDLRYHQSKSVMSLLHMLDQEIILKPLI